MNLATCIGCGCDDERACVDIANASPCHWLRVDYEESAVGVCSKCPSHQARWDAGDRSLSAAARDEFDDEEELEDWDDEDSLILPGDEEYDETLRELG